MRIIRTYCPDRVRYALRGMFDEAYDLTNRLYGQVDWIGNTIISQKDIRAHILRAALANTAKLFCSKGTIPFIFREETNTIGNCSHIELIGKRAIILPCRVSHPSELPAYSIFRNNYTQYLNMDSLFPEYQKKSNVKYVAATYGDRGTSSFKFGKIGIPGEATWIDSLPLEQGPYMVFSTKEEKEELLVGIKEQMKEVGLNDGQSS